MPRAKLTEEDRLEKHRERQRRYLENNRDKARESARISQAKRRLDPLVREMDKAYKKRPEYKEQQAKYRAENRDELNAATRQWQIENSEKFKAYHLEYRAKNSLRISAKTRN